MIELKDVAVEYRTPGQPPRKVLENLNLTIRPGEFLAVCGQTGCGKSTMLRLILGAELPSVERCSSKGVNYFGPIGIAVTSRRSIRFSRIKRCSEILLSAR